MTDQAGEHIPDSNFQAARTERRGADKEARLAETNRRLHELTAATQTSPGGERAYTALNTLTSNVDAVVQTAIERGQLQAFVGQTQPFELGDSDDEATLETVLKTFGAHLNQPDLPNRQSMPRVDANIHQFHSYHEELPPLRQHELMDHREGSFRLVDQDGATKAVVIRTDIPGVRLALDGSAISEGDYRGRVRFHLLVDTGLDTGHVEAAQAERKKRLDDTEVQVMGTLRNIMLSVPGNPRLAEADDSISRLVGQVTPAVQRALKAGNALAQVVQHGDFNIHRADDNVALRVLMEGLGVEISAQDSGAGRAVTPTIDMLPYLSDSLPTYSENEAASMTSGSFTVKKEQGQEVRLSTRIPGVSLLLEGPGLASKSKGHGGIRPMLLIDTTVHDPGQQ